MTNNKLKIKDFLILSFILLIVSLIYINTLDNPFIWDDEVIIESNQFIKDWGSMGDIFEHDIFGASLEQGSFYRPLHALSYMIDYSLWGFNTLGYHITSIFLFLLLLIVLYLLFIQLGLKKILSFILVLGFGVHPINTEMVTFISARGDIIMILFSLLSFLVFLRAIYKKNNLFFILSIFLFILAFLSKESAVVLPIIMGLYLFLFKRDKYKTFLGWFLILVFLSFGYTAFRLIMVGSGQSIALSNIAQASLITRLITLPRIFLTYIVKLIIPFNLHMEYLFVEKSILSLSFILGLPAIILFFYAILRFLKFSKYSLFFTGWFFMGLLPFYQIFLPLAATLREHWVSFSAIGFLGLMALVFKKIFLKLKKEPKARLGFILLIVAIFIYWAGSSLIRNKIWESPKGLYQNDLKYEPNSFLLHNNLGVEYFRESNYFKAKKHFLAANRVTPGLGYAPAYNNLGVIYQREAKTDQAIYCYLQSIKINDYILAYQNLADLYIKKNKTEKARSVLEQGLNLYPNNQILLKYKENINHF